MNAPLSCLRAIERDVVYAAICCYAPSMIKRRFIRHAPFMPRYVVDAARRHVYAHYLFTETTTWRAPRDTLAR